MKYRNMIYQRYASCTPGALALSSDREKFVKAGVSEAFNTIYDNVFPKLQTSIKWSKRKQMDHNQFKKDLLN